VRVIAATNKSLDDQIEAGNFRDDLYFRLNVIPIEVPPLRERGDDIVLLAEHYLRQFAIETGQRPKKLSEGAVRKIMSHPWPGNVRELRNMIERVTILVQDNEILPGHLDLGKRPSGSLAIGGTELPLRDARERFEREYILRKLREMGGNVSRTAEALGVERSNLYRKLNQYGIEIER